MDKGPKAPKRGRPSAKAEQPRVESVKPKSKILTKRKDPSREPKLFTISSGGGIYYKLRSSKVMHYDEGKNELRELRYCSREPSVFVDEQSNRAVRSHVIFRDGNLLVRPNEPNLLAYLNLHPDNMANGGTVFEMMNKDVDHEKIVENEFLIHDAISLIKSRPTEELYPLAMALNIDINQSALSVKRALVSYAKQNPQKFLDMNSNPLVEARGTVQQAFDFDIIRNNTGAVVWSDTNKMVVAIPAGMDKIQVVTRFVMTDAGAPTLAEIERQLAEIAS